MNILIITAMFPPIRTGTSFYSQNLATAFHNQGHTVTLITARNDESLNDNFNFPIIRIKALHININNYFKHFRICSIFPGNYSKISKIAKEKNADIILLINHYLDIAFPAIYAASKNKIPLIISVGTQMQSKNPIRNKILRFLDRFICGNFIFPFCKKIISWDSEIERYIKSVQKKKIANKSVIIAFGVNGSTEIYHNYHHDYSLVNQILGVGAVISQRDYLFNIRVFKRLLNLYPHLKLKIIGHIFNKQAIDLVKELGLQNNVEFMGEQAHDVVINEMKKSCLHWMMMDGDYVGLGTSNIEAMLLGVPIISNIPENLFGDHLIRDMKEYIYTDVISEEKITEKIKDILDNKSLRKQIGDSGKFFVIQHLNWEIVASQQTKLFEGILNK